MKPEHTFLLCVTVLIVCAPLSATESLRGEVPVPGGMFVMGSETGGRDEPPARNVVVGSFFMMETEVTVAQFREFVDAAAYLTSAETRGGATIWSLETRGWAQKADASWANPYVIRSEPEQPPYYTGQADDEPVIHVSWFDAIEYANWLSAVDGLEPAYIVEGNSVRWARDRNGWRLPTEAEWEYAARGGPVGQETVYAGGNDLDRVAWHGNNADGRPRPVATRAPNELGIYDLSGNVFEHCWDWFAPYGPADAIDPAGPPEGTRKTIRGGSFRHRTSFFTVSFRGVNNQGIHGTSNDFGFRLVRTAR